MSEVDVVDGSFEGFPSLSNVRFFGQPQTRAETDARTNPPCDANHWLQSGPVGVRVVLETLSQSNASTIELSCHYHRANHAESEVKATHVIIAWRSWLTCGPKWSRPTFSEFGANSSCTDLTWHSLRSPSYLVN